MHGDVQGCSELHEVARGGTGMHKGAEDTRGHVWAAEVAQPGAHGCTRPRAIAPGCTRMHGEAQRCTRVQEVARGLRAHTGTAAEGHPRTPKASRGRPRAHEDARPRARGCTRMHERMHEEAGSGRPLGYAYSPAITARPCYPPENTRHRGARGGHPGGGGGWGILGGEGGRGGEEEEGGFEPADGGSPGRGLESRGVGIQHHGQRQRGL